MATENNPSLKASMRALFIVLKTGSFIPNSLLQMKPPEAYKKYAPNKHNEEDPTSRYNTFLFHL
jgi:hypothetical protein